jgi:SAM-dependent methyltransferase
MRLNQHADQYHAYAQIYDAFKGDRGETIRLIKRLIQKHRPGSRFVLELACGSGGILQGLAESFTVAGLDNSRAMLKLARKKLPGVQLVLADMTDFRLEPTFDVVCCLHNSVNHLVAFRQWEALFAAASAHLKPDGLFIFDINSPERMNKLMECPRVLEQAGEHYVATEVTQNLRRPERYSWGMDIFLHKRKNSFALERTVVEVSAWPVEKISKSLKKHFEILDHFTLAKAETRDEINRGYFVCAKRQIMK